MRPCHPRGQRRKYYEKSAAERLHALHRGRGMKRTLTTIRCVPRYGYDETEVRTVELDLSEDFAQPELDRALAKWFAVRGIADAVFAIDQDDEGFYAIINDEAYASEWGQPLL